MGYKVYGCIVVDTDTKTIKSVHTPVILDLVQDRVRSRVYSVLLTILVIIAAAFWALGPALRYAHIKSVPLAVAEVSLILPQAISVIYGSTFDPAPMVTVVAADSTVLAGRLVTMYASLAGSEGRDELAMTLYLPFLEGILTETSNVAGTAVFSNVRFYGSSQVSYTIYFECEGVISSPVVITVLTNVASLIFLDLPWIDPMPVIGQPINYNFSIQVLDVFGTPLPNKTVYANISPNPQLLHLFPNYGMLENNASISDDFGEADFNFLTITLVNTNRISFQFYCEGVLLTPTYVVLGMEIVTQVAIVVITTPPPLHVTEGQPFVSQSVITVLDSSGNPLAGRNVMAMVTTEAGLSANPKILAFSKVLQNVLAAPTNSSGRTSFDYLTFALGGSAGVYGITFYCDGVASEEAIVFVNTTVGSVIWSSALPQNITVNQNGVIDVVIVTMKVLDMDNNPIKDKTVFLKAVQDWGNITISATMTDEIGSATFTLWELPSVQAQNETNTATLILVAETDNVASLPASIKISVIPPYSTETILYVEVLHPPAGIYSIASPTSGFQPLIRCVNYRGDPAPNVNISIQIMPRPMYWTMFPYLDSPVSTAYLLTGGGTTDEQGYLQFGAPGSAPFGVLRGYGGTLPIGFVASDWFCSDIFFVQVFTPIIAVTLIHPSTFMNVNNFEPLPFVPLNLSVVVTCAGSCENLPPIFPELSILDGPIVSTGLFFGSTGSLFDGPGDNVIPPDFEFWNGYMSEMLCTFNTSNIGLCNFSNMTVRGYSGGFTIMAKVAGILSNPLNLTIGGIATYVEPLASNVSKTITRLQQNFPLVPYVQVLDQDYNPIAGIYVYVSVCGNPPGVVVYNDLPSAQCNDCIFSNASDENGIVSFEALTFYAGGTGEYNLCFAAGTLDPTPWDAAIYVINPIVDITPLETQNVITPGPEHFIAGIRVMAYSNLELIVDVVQVAGSAQLALTRSQDYSCQANSDCIIHYDVAGPDGIYTFAYIVSGQLSDTNITIALDSTPSKVAFTTSFLQNSSDIIPVDLFHSVPVVLVTTTAATEPVINANFSVSIASQPNGSRDAHLAGYTCAGKMDIYCLYNLMFDAGASGIYELVFTSGSAISVPMRVNLTNPISNIEITNAKLIVSATVGVPLPVQPSISVSINAPINIGGQLVTAVLQDVAGNWLYYSVTPVLDKKGNAQFLDLTFMVQIPGTYMLQFVVAGVKSEAIPVQLQNPGFPNYAHLNLHHTQVRVVLGVLLVIPLYIGNSIRQPAWQLIFSVPSLAGIGYIAYSNLFSEIEAKLKLSALGFSYYLLDVAMRGILLVSVITFFTVVILVIRGVLRKSYTSFYDEKIISCRPYIRQELLCYGMQRYIEKHAEIQTRPAAPVYSKPSLLIRLKSFFLRKNFIQERGLLIQDYEPVSQNSQVIPTKTRKPHTAFFFPMRLLLAFGAAITCALLVACICIFLINEVVLHIDARKSQIDSLLVLSVQMRDLTMAGSNGDFWSTDKIEAVAAVLAISPQQLETILAYIQEGSLVTGNYMSEIDELLVRFRHVFQISAAISLGMTSAIVLATWFFVFRKYKQRIFYMRRGRVDLITRNIEKFTIRGAANYVGLQSLHSSIGFFVIWILLTITIITLQLKVFWLWIWSYFPILVAFLLGLPFISKTITKFIIAHWVLKDETILHLRLWLIFDFMWIFVNLLSSIVLSAIRFTFAIGSSIIYAMRMDAPLLREENDYLDYGFKAYMGMLLMDFKHNNPVLLQFTTLLVDEMKKERAKRKKKILEHAKDKWRLTREQEQQVVLIPPVVEEAIDFYSAPDNSKARSRIVHKWWLLVTLHNNPQLQPLRKHHLITTSSTPPPPLTLTHH